MQTGERERQVIKGAADALDLINTDLPEGVCRSTIRGYFQPFGLTETAQRLHTLHNKLEAEAATQDDPGKPYREAMDAVLEWLASQNFGIVHDEGYLHSSFFVGMSDQEMAEQFAAAMLAKEGNNG